MANCLAGSLIRESFPPKAKVSAADLPDLSGKVMFVTGGNAGLGKETCKTLLQKNAKVYLAARDQKKAQATIDELKTVTGKEAHFIKLDLANLRSVKAAAEEFLSKENQLDVLFNNGGVMVPPVEQLTEDGYDLQFGTNVLGHFYLTKLLLPVLLQTAQASQDGKVRVVNTSSSAHLFYGINFDALTDTPERKKLGSQMLYCQSKTGNVIFARELARRYGDKGIVATALNPGNIKTELLRHANSVQSLVMKGLLYEPEKGALTQLWAGCSEEGAGWNGKYLVPWARVAESHVRAQDPVVNEKLWDWMEEQVKGL